MFCKTFQTCKHPITLLMTSYIIYVRSDPFEIKISQIKIYYAALNFIYLIFCELTTKQKNDSIWENMEKINKTFKLFNK